MNKSLASVAEEESKGKERISRSTSFGSSKASTQISHKNLSFPFKRQQSAVRHGARGLNKCSPGRESGRQFRKDSQRILEEFCVKSDGQSSPRNRMFKKLQRRHKMEKFLAADPSSESDMDSTFRPRANSQSSTAGDIDRKISFLNKFRRGSLHVEAVTGKNSKPHLSKQDTILQSVLTEMHREKLGSLSVPDPRPGSGSVVRQMTLLKTKNTS